VVYGHNDPMAVGAYLAAQELGREKKMIFVGVDGLGGPAGGIKKVMDGVLAVTFYYPLAVDKAMEIGNRMLREPGFYADKNTRWALRSSRRRMRRRCTSVCTILNLCCSLRAGSATFRWHASVVQCRPRRSPRGRCTRWWAKTAREKARSRRSSRA
jgi:hypothetical protein